MYKISLIGRDIGYTRSPQIHEAVFAEIGESVEFCVCDIPYDRLKITVDGLKNSDGFFVTKPYKSDICAVLGCEPPVNVVRCKDMRAFCTDGDGFICALDVNFDGWRDRVKGALVLGAGGAARAVTSSLIALGKKVYILDRTALKAAKLCAAVGSELYCNNPAELIVNCTPLGFNGEDALYTMCVLPEFDYAYDLVYGVGATRLMRRCASAGAKVADGEDMLVFQAILGDKIITGGDFDTQKVFNSVKRKLQFD